MIEKALEEEKVTASSETATKTAAVSAQTATKAVKSQGERIFAKISEMESGFVILKNELQNLSPQELAKFQSLKKESTGKNDNLSATQKRLIKIVKEGDEKFIRALANVVNSLMIINEAK
jgi:hypothetical protein